MQSVYLETAIFGYLASRPNSDSIVAGNQQLTSEWWIHHRQKFELFVAQPVVAECLAGDKEAADERLAFFVGLPVLDVVEEANELAKTLLADVPLPAKADVDALHIAISALNGMDYLLTWNCKQIANPSLRRRIEEVLLASNVLPPIICTPQEWINV